MSSNDTENDWEDVESSNGPSLLEGKFRFLDPNLDEERYNNDGFETETSELQEEVEDNVRSFFQVFKCNLDVDPMAPFLEKREHIDFIKRGLHNLPVQMECLDCSRPWFCFWMLHSLELLNAPIPEEIKTQFIQFLDKCQHPNGGFGGGPGQEPHLAPTYAAICSLCILRSQEAYNIINREKLLQFLIRMKQPDGSFCLHIGSETDIRGLYCALCVAMLTNIWSPELTKNSAHYISRCQTYEGGFGGTPGNEAHGGYTFCGLASLVLLKEGKLINVHRLLRWLVNRQMKFEGGFQGCTNKLVDACYSFWQGSSFPLIHRLLCKTEPEILNMDTWLFSQRALQEYVLVCCQAPNGGLKDKPGKPVDYYHTCYALSGLSIAQHFHFGTKEVDCVVGHERNELLPNHPIYNISVLSAMQAIRYFQALPLPTAQSPGPTDDNEFSVNVPSS